MRSRVYVTVERLSVCLSVPLLGVWGFLVVCKNFWKVSRIPGVSHGFLECASASCSVPDSHEMYLELLVVY